jgi:mRNA-degrading endonuclease toxin of MazEF toxin-antitoxin module
LVRVGEADFDTTGLKTDSIIRLDKISTVERRLLTRRLGKLANERMKTVDQALILALGISHAVNEIGK